MELSRDCQFSSYAQCMATASGTDGHCGINPRYAFALQRAATIGPNTEQQSQRRAALPLAAKQVQLP